MEKLEGLELIEDLVTENLVRLTFLDQDREEIHEVDFHRMSYNKATQNWEESAEAEDRTRSSIMEYFGVELEDLDDVLGEKRNVYCYETFDSLWEIDSKFELDEVNQIYTCKIREVRAEPSRIAIRFIHGDRTYRANMNFTTRLKSGKAMVNSGKKRKALQKFERLFGFPVEEKEKAKGMSIMVKIARLGNHVYPEILKVTD